jgi:hypothetical protein
MQIQWMHSLTEFWAKFWTFHMCLYS